MWLTVDHVTTYRYDRPVRGVVQSLRLTPAVCDGQKVRAWEVSVSGGIRGGSFRDGAGDLVQAWSVPGPVDEITVAVRGAVETVDTAGILRGHREFLPPMVYLTETPVTLADDALRAIATAAAAADGRLAMAHAMAGAVAAAITWTPGATGTATTAAEALAQGTGVCQDHAHALIAAARTIGFPARYVAGYLFAEEAAGEPIAGQAGHAWAELWVDGLGWVGFDPANACCPDARYVRLGSGLDAADAAPIRGTARGGPGAERLEVAVRVTAGQAQSQQ